jgi:oligopeptide transport system substrate-binding protein
LGVQALDDHRLEIRLAAPTPYLLGLLTHASTFPIHRASLAQHRKGFARPGKLISNGAYQLIEWREQARVRLVRNPYYWNHAATRIAVVDYHPTEDSSTELARYRADELDITAEIPVQQAPWLRQQFGSALRIAPYLGSYYYGINTGQPPFAGRPKLRLALSLAVDREVIVSKVMHGLARPAYSYVPPGVLDYTPQVPEWASWSRAQRLALARKLYAEAGYSAQKPLKVQLRFNTNEGHRRIAVVVAAMWRQWLGVQTELINEEFKVFINHRNLRQLTQIFRASWIADYNDASSFADILHSTHGQNDSGWQSPAYDALLTQAAKEADASRRRALLEQAERLVLAETPVLPIYTYVSKHLVKPWVHGWQDNAMDYHYSKDLSLAARAR